MMASREEGMPAIGSPLRRKRLQTEDNIRISTHLSAANLRRPRINTLNNEEEDRPSRQVSLRKATSKMTLSPIKFCTSALSKTRRDWQCPARHGLPSASPRGPTSEDGSPTDWLSSTAWCGWWWGGYGWDCWRDRCRWGGRR